MATFTITSTTDNATDTGIGTVDANGNSSGTLREAINFANQNVATPGTVTTIGVAQGVTGTITCSGDLPLVATSMQFDGGGLTLDGGSTYRGFLISGIAANGRSAAPTTVGISNLTIQNVTATGGAGTDDGGGGLGAGGAVFVGPAANVTLTNVGISNAKAAGGAGGEVARGGLGGGGGLGGVGGSDNGNSGGGGGILFAGGSSAGTIKGNEFGTDNGGGGGGGITSAGGTTTTMPGGAGGTGLGGLGGGGGGGGAYAKGGAGGGTGADAGSDSMPPVGGTGTGGRGGFGGGGGGGGFSDSGGGAGGGGNGGFGGGGGGGSYSGLGYLNLNSTYYAGNGGFGGGGGGGSSGGVGGIGGFGGGGGSGGIHGVGGFAGGGGTSTFGGGGGGGGLGGAVFVAGGGTLTIAGTASETGGTVTPGAGAYISGSGFKGSENGSAFDAGIFYEGGTAAAPATLTFGAGNQSIADAIGDLDGAAGNNTTANGLGGTGGVTALAKTGSGALTLSGANTFKGATTISDGTLALSGTGSIADSSSVADSGTFDISGLTTDFTVIGALSGTGKAALGVNALEINGDGATFAGTIVNHGLSLGQGGGLQILSGTQTLAGQNTYTGITGITGGATLALVGNGTVADSLYVAATGTFDISQLSGGATIKGLLDTSARGVVTLGTRTLTIADGADQRFVGAINGSGGLTIASGAQELDSASTFTGATTIKAGATLDIGSFDVSVVATANGSIATASGVTANGTFDISSLANGGTSIKTLTGTGGVSLGANDLTLTAAANATFAGTIGDGGTNGGTGGAVTLAGGTETLSGQNTYTGGTTISGGTLDLAVADTVTNEKTTMGAAGTGAITFAGSSAHSATLALDTTSQPTTGAPLSPGPTFGNTLTNFDSASDALDLQGFAFNTLDQIYIPVNNTLTVTDAAGQTESFALSNGAAAYTAQRDGTGTLIKAAAVCFAAGTLIRTTRGDVAVEALKVGDLVVTAAGAHRPIKWLGHRTLDCRNHPRPHEVMPVRISAHAFGPGRPARDLSVSPGHSICVDIVGEVLIPAAALVNGSTIAQENVERVTYWHVELDSHDILLAEGLPAESYLDMGNRGFFAEADVVDLAAGPDAVARTHADFCRPFHVEGALVEVVRTRLTARAEQLGWTLDQGSPFADLHLVVDGTRIEPMTRGLSARFIVPAGASDVWLASTSARPCDVGVNADSRALGVWLAGLTIEDGFAARSIALDDPLLGPGLHAIETNGCCWTAGRAKLAASLWDACEHGFYLRIDLAGPALPRLIRSGEVEEYAEQASFRV